MHNSKFKKFSITLLAIWLLFLALIPFALVFIGSFLKPGAEDFFAFQITLGNYAKLFYLPYFKVFLRSFYLAGITAFFCLLLAYPFVYILVKLKPRLRAVMLFLLIIPFWTSSLIRIYSLIIFIRAHGLLNHFLLYFGIIQHPLEIMFTQTAILIGMIYSMLPFMILPLYANLEKFDWRLIEAAQDLGASRLYTLYKIILPITMPGIVAGIILVLLPAVTMFYIPDILGGAKSVLLGNLIKNQFIEVKNWPMGCAISVALTVIMGVMLIIYHKASVGKERQALL